MNFQLSEYIFPQNSKFYQRQKRRQGKSKVTSTTVNNVKRIIELSRDDNMSQKHFSKGTDIKI